MSETRVALLMMEAVSDAQHCDSIELNLINTIQPPSAAYEL